MSHLDDAEAELKLDVLVMDVDQVLNRLVDGVQGATDDIDAHLASAGDRHRVRIDRLEALLEDGLLTAGRRDLLLALVTVKVLLEDGVDNEARSMKV